MSCNLLKLKKNSINLNYIKYIPVTVYTLFYEIGTFKNQNQKML